MWKETPTGWIKAKEYRGHESSVNAVAWAPHEFGLSLACASSDGKVSILTYQVETSSWDVKEWSAHQIGCNAVAWCPSSRPESLISAMAMTGGLKNENNNNSSPSMAIMRLATGGCDNLVKIWKYQ